ncbi:MAG: hypothetical protein HRU38_15830, partial [Saccharospirillaceae bacterium]|nr:hypothetical protein [Saccharospirillaceae bacterium]
MNKKLTSLSLLVILLTSIPALAQTTTNKSTRQLSSTDMNHLFYTPTTRVNEKDEITVSFHEVAYGLGNNLHVQFSLFDNIGRSNFNVKYQLAESFVIGAGLGASFATLPPGNHALHSNDQRLALYLTGKIAENSISDIYITGHAQVAEVASLGLDLGINFKQADNFNIIIEAGSSYDTNSQDLYMNVNVGLRIFFSQLESSYLDLGIDLHDFNVTTDYNPGPQGVSIYFDFC